MSQTVFEELKSKLMGITNKGHEAISEFDPDYVKAVMEFYLHYSMEREGSVLPRKTKELIIMVVSASKSSQEGVRLHMKRALLAGASPKEVLEALQAAAIPGGLPIMWTGAEVLAEELKAMNKSFC